MTRVLNIENGSAAYPYLGPLPEFLTRPWEMQPPHGPSYPSLQLPETRFYALPLDPPTSPPPYSSVWEDVLQQIELFKAADGLREVARFPFTLHAGETPPQNGSFGMHTEPRPYPELLGGAIFPETLTGHIYTSSI